MDNILYLTTATGLFCLLSGAAIDLIIGDPERPVHPVVLMGAAISFGEKLCRSFVSLNPLIQGAILATGLTCSAYLVTYAILKTTLAMGLILYLLLSSIIICYGLALRTLYQEVIAVAQALETDGIDAARKQIARLVGRDTTTLDQHQISAAAIETASENMVDGVMTPFFYAAIGGPPLLAAYKMISTMDSMIAYKTERYILFGRVAARLDDAANYIPARLSLPFIAAGARILGLSTPSEKIIRKARTEGKNCPSPNSGLPESGFAWALNVRLGGPSIYFGRLTPGHWYNQNGKRPGPEDIRQAARLMMISSILFYLAFLIPGFLLAGIL